MQIDQYQYAKIYSIARHPEEHSTDDHSLHVWSSTAKRGRGEEKYYRDGVERSCIVFCVEFSKRQYRDKAAGHKSEGHQDLVGQRALCSHGITYPTESQGRSGTLSKSLTIDGTKSATIVPSKEYVNMLERIATTTRNH